jgi:exopolysaccharide biosynthesis WecB/TagA/CpsF family protein
MSEDGQVDARADSSVVNVNGSATQATNEGFEPHRSEAGASNVVPLKTLPRRVTSGVEFLDLTFDALPVEEAARAVSDRADRRAPFVYVVTPNVDHRVRLRREPSLKSIYEAAWMTLCDSRIIEMLARFDGLKLHASPGADLVEHLFKHTIRPADPINIIGNTEDVVETLRTRFKLTNLRWHTAPMDIRNCPAAIAEAASFVAANPSRFTFICVGSPQQEIVANAIAERGDASGVGICCGASLEFLSGKVPRAPRWMRNIALEWLHRLATNPARFGRRYLLDGPKIFPIWLSSRDHDDTDDDHGTPSPVCGDVVSVHPAA